MAAVDRSRSWLGLDSGEPDNGESAPAPVGQVAPVTDRRLATIHLTSFHQARTVGERFREGVPVLMDLSGMDDAGAKRVVDFASGLVFGLRGGMDRIAPRVFLVLPAGTELTHATPR